MTQFEPPMPRDALTWQALPHLFDISTLKVRVLVVKQLGGTPVLQQHGGVLFVIAKQPEFQFGRCADDQQACFRRPLAGRVASFRG